MRVRGHLLRRQRHVLRAADGADRPIGQARALTDAQDRPALQVRQREIVDAISAIIGTENRI